METASLPPLKVIQAVAGTFHHFDLARELDSYGCLKSIYSTFPWIRLKREGVPRAKVHTFPWIHGPIMAVSRYTAIPRGISTPLHLANARLFDSWVASQIEECDVFVGISGFGLKTGRLVQRRGGKYVCDRGSSHIRVQARILHEEHARWGLKGRPVHPSSIIREETEYAQADAITVPSEFARRSFIEMGIDPAKVTKIPYGVRLDRFSKTSDPPPDSFDVLFAGNVTLQKGV
ncbi:MAG: glycosyltransferase, partial [Acidobacteriaceae bacterium]